MSESYLQWMAKRGAISKARLEAMTPITPVPTPLLDLLARKPTSVKNG